MDFRTKSGSVCRQPFRVAGWRCAMDEDFITLEVEEEGRGRLQFELPLDITDEEIAYIKSLVPRAESGLLELLDPTRVRLFSAAPPYLCSDTWQLVINTGTTIVTFLMVFLIQNTQKRDSEAIQVKLDE